LLAVVAPVSLVGLTAYAVATVAFARDPGSATTVAGVGAFLLASTLAERFPVPVEGADANGVSLGFVFALAALVLFGWAPATFVYASAPTLVAIGRRNPFIRTIFNAGVFGLTGALAGWVLTQFHEDTTAVGVLWRVSLTAVILFTVNLVLVSAAIAASSFHAARLRGSTTLDTARISAKTTSPIWHACMNPAPSMLSTSG